MDKADWTPLYLALGHHKDVNAKHMMDFGDWLKRRSMDKSWITVAQHDVNECDGWMTDYFMTAVLVTIDSYGALLTDSRWLAKKDFGNADVWKDNGRVRVKVQTAKRVDKNGDARIEPFTFLRLWNGTWPSRFELIQNFMLFYNLHFDARDCKYVAVDDAGNTTEVIRIKNETPHEKIEIRTRFLRNYLACRCRVLVRQHDNRIYGNKTLADLGIEPFTNLELAGSDYRFDHTVAANDLTDQGPGIGLLTGKDLVRPFDRCHDLLGWPKGNSEFKTGLDDHGDVVMASYSEGDGPTVFLTPVYFEREVLKKYYDVPNYKVELRMVSCSAWSIKKYTNKADLIRVHLGDLARLPPAEQRHWQNCNVLPEDADPGGQFIDSDTVAHKFRESLSVFQGTFEDQFGFPPFRPLRGDDAYKEASIRVPLNDAPGEFEEQIQNLAILLPDSINKRRLEPKMASLLSEPTRLPDSIDEKQLECLDAKYKGKNKPNKIPMLEDFLVCKSLPTAIIFHLRMIQNLRSSGVVHRKGSRHDKNTDKYAIGGDSGKETIRKLFMNMADAFDGLTLAIRTG